MPPLVLLSGFGPYERVRRNPSGALARRLLDDPPPGVEVRATELPVSFDRAPRAWDELLDSVRPRLPDLLLGLGAQRGPGFRLELRARARLTDGKRRDVDGVAASGCVLPDGPDHESGIDLDALVEGLAAEGIADVRVSENAGGYVCERFYHHLLSRAATLHRPGLFMHVPPLPTLDLARQSEVVGHVVALVVRQVCVE